MKKSGNLGHPLPVADLCYYFSSLISVCSLGTGWDKLGNGAHPPQAHSPWKGATLALPFSTLSLPQACC